jgi:hypothetical protein
MPRLRLTFALDCHVKQAAVESQRNDRTGFSRSGGGDSDKAQRPPLAQRDLAYATSVDAGHAATAFPRPHEAGSPDFKFNLS